MTDDGADDPVLVDYATLRRMLRQRGYVYAWSDEFDCWLEVYKYGFLDAIDRDVHYEVRYDGVGFYVWAVVIEMPT